METRELRRLLPSVIERTIRPGEPLSALLQVMESLHAPSEAVLDRIEVFFDPRRAPAPFVPYLARWVDLTVSVSTGLGRTRELVAAAVDLSSMRGTKLGLQRFLETATGMKGFAIDERVMGPDGCPRPFHVRVDAPAEAAAHRTMLAAIIELEKPAYVTYELRFGGAAEERP